MDNDEGKVPDVGKMMVMITLMRARARTRTRMGTAKTGMARTGMARMAAVTRMMRMWMTVMCTDRYEGDMDKDVDNSCDSDRCGQV